MAKTKPAPGKFISIRGAREHNLKNVDLDLPRDSLIVLTGLSGSGKSSLAFDTIYAEGQRRYVEWLSAYARQFLEMMQKPDVDQIDGLSPAISIEQKTTSRNPRSTVGTVTEIYDYMRLLFARVGVPYSPATGLPIESQTVSQMVDRVLALPEGTRLYLLAPIVRGRKGEYRKELGRAAEARLPAGQDRRRLPRDRRGPGARQEDQARHRGGGRPHRRARRHRHPPRRFLPDRARARRRHRHRRIRGRARARAGQGNRPFRSPRPLRGKQENGRGPRQARKGPRTRPARWWRDVSSPLKGGGSGRGLNALAAGNGPSPDSPLSGDGERPESHRLLREIRLPGLRLHHPRDRAAAVLVQQSLRRLPGLRRPRLRAHRRRRRWSSPTTR